jgi:hypothetical protein
MGVGIGLKLSMQKLGFQYPLTKANSQLQFLIKPNIAEFLLIAGEGFYGLSTKSSHRAAHAFSSPPLNAWDVTTMIGEVRPFYFPLGA